MGFLDENQGGANSDKLDLIGFEKAFLERFNDDGIMKTKYRAEELGVFFDKAKNAPDVYLYQGEEEVVVCPEPFSFIKEFDEVSDNAAKADALFRQKRQDFHVIRLDKKPTLKGNADFRDRMWMNKTASGINLRAGNLNDDRENFEPVKMCDDNVHALVVGRTGSGKSVFINALILSLLTEYPPWELDLYLADFKKVELSRYMNDADENNQFTAFTPHVNACAATSEIRYVISMIRYLVDCMNARQELFARLGVTKIQEFRKKYDVVLPRVLLMVDEFQQLFQEATTREADELQTMLNAITKLGRATGFHLLFASQEMSGTLSGNTLSNFKIRMALPCEAGISTDILGNAKAATLARGYVLVNTDAGQEDKNKKYRVPFIETDKKDTDDKGKSPFYAFLDEYKLAGLDFDLTYKKMVQKFYREELQEAERDYLADLDKISAQKNQIIRRSSTLFDAVVLGKTVLYSPKYNDKVSFYIEKGRSKGIMVACPDADNAAQIRKLLAENLCRSGEKTYHFALELNDRIYERFRMKEYCARYPEQEYCKCETDKALQYPIAVYAMRQAASRALAQNEQALAQMGVNERQLLALQQDPEEKQQYQAFLKKKVRLAQELEACTRAMQQVYQGNDEADNPVEHFLEGCSDEVVSIPAFGPNMSITGLNIYPDVQDTFAQKVDVRAATEEAVKLVGDYQEKVEALNLSAEQIKLTVLRLKLLKAAVRYYCSRYYGEEPKETSFNSYMDKAYAPIVDEVQTYKAERQKAQHAQTEYNRLAKQKRKLQAEQKTMEKSPEPIYLLQQQMQHDAEEFMRPVLESAYSAMRYPGGEQYAAKVQLEADGETLQWKLQPGAMDEKLVKIGEDILRLYAAMYRGEETDTTAFARVIVWINGLDEVERTPNKLEEMVRGAMNQNILVIAIITSELQDSILWKTFDYGFVTGNVEKFYDKMDIRYTKQPMDSIVVNFGVRSKGMNLPFKMYKSRLEEIQTPNFLDDLLNA